MDKIKEFLEERTPDDALVEASKNGQYDIVKFIITKGLSTNYSEAIKYALQASPQTSEHANIVELLSIALTLYRNL